MDLPCPSCAKTVRIPDDQNDQPGRRAMCVHCRKSFVVPESLLGESAAPPLATTTSTTSIPLAPLSRAARLAPQSIPGVTARPSPLSRSGIGPLPDIARASTTGAHGTQDAWATCALHPGAPAADVCETCNVGYCHGCARPMPGGKVCPTCQRPTIPVAEKRREAERLILRARAFLSELPTIAMYPLRDPLSFAILTLLVGLFGAARGVSMGVQAAGFSYIFGQGLLMAYAFTALRRVAHGDLTAGMPDLAGLDDLLRPVRLSAAAFLLAAAPLLGVALACGPTQVSTFLDLSRGAARPAPARVAAAPPPSATPVATEDGEAGMDPNTIIQRLADQAQAVQAGQATSLEAPPEPEPVPPSGALPSWAPFAITLAILWALGYFPVAFMVAAISQSVLSTLDPREGLRAILVMGGTYWQAVGVTSVLFVACGAVRSLAGAHPAAGFLVNPLVESYQWLAVGCTLGLAIFKRAEALGFD